MKTNAQIRASPKTGKVIGWIRVKIFLMQTKTMEPSLLCLVLRGKVKNSLGKGNRFVGI